MKRFLRAGIIALLASVAWSQTTTSITGTIKDLTQALVTSGQVTFTLSPSRDTTISGIARFSPQTVTCLINASGQITSLTSGTCTLTMNTALNPPGSYYTVAVWPYYVKTSTFTFYAVLSSYDWSTVVPTPTTSPAQNFVDIFSNQTIAGSKSFTGPVTFSTPLSGYLLTSGGTLTGPLLLPSAFVTNTGVFTNSAMNLYLTSGVGGCNVATEYNASQGANFDTEGISGCVTIPNTSTVHQGSGVAGYATSVANSSGGTVNNAVGGYFQGRTLSNNSAVWGFNSLVQDIAGQTGHILLNEMDLNISGAPNRVTGLLVTGKQISGTMPAAPPIGNTNGSLSRASLLEFFFPGSLVQFPAGLVFCRGCVSGTGLQLDGTCPLTVAPCSSQSITLTGYDSGGTLHTALIQADSTGSLDLFASTAGAAKIRAGNFSALPTCNNGNEGMYAGVTDSATNTWGATITGSSTNHVLAYCDGTNWTVAGK